MTAHHWRLLYRERQRLQGHHARPQEIGRLGGVAVGVKRQLENGASTVSLVDLFQNSIDDRSIGMGITSQDRKRGCLIWDS